MMKNKTLLYAIVAICVLVILGTWLFVSVNKSTVLVVEDQQTNENHIIIREARLEKAGYIVVKDSHNGKPGRNIGSSKLLQPGIYRNIAIGTEALRQGTNDLFALIFPRRVENSVVMEYFTVTIAMAVTYGGIGGGEKFQTLGQDVSVTAELSEPAVFVAGSISEAARFTKWLSPNVATRIQEVDFSNGLVVAVFSGPQPSSGFGITIQEVRAGPGIVRLIVNITEPTPGRAVSDIITYPYHIIYLLLDTAPGTNWIARTLEQNELILEVEGYGYANGDIIEIKTGSPTVGDVIMYESYKNRNMCLSIGSGVALGRILGVPGETFSFQNGNLQIRTEIVKFDRDYSQQRAIFGGQKYENLVARNIILTNGEYLIDKWVGLECVAGEIGGTVSSVYNRFTVNEEAIIGIIVEKIGHDQQVEEKFWHTVY